MPFQPRIVGWTDVDDWIDNSTTQENVVQLHWNWKWNSSGTASDYTPWTDPFENNGEKLLDIAFNTRINAILDTVFSLENTNSKDREAVWMEWRVKHWIKEMTDSQLKNIVMLSEDKEVKTKPSYFTAICWEIMERVVWNVGRVIENK